PLIKMDGAKTYVYATRTMAAVATAAIERAGLTPSQVNLVIPHQANIRIIEHVSKAIDYPMEQIFVNLDKYGNTSAASIPIALSEAVAAGRLKPGDVFCTVAFGGGYTSGAFVTMSSAPWRSVVATPRAPSSRAGMPIRHTARVRRVWMRARSWWFAPRMGRRWTWSLRRFVRTWTGAVAKSKLIGNSTLINISTKEAACLN
ncbi:MAG: hypothetical protein RL715_186, partial [Chloroflexota bacterium]